jgi:hypothetical protein
MKGLAARRSGGKFKVVDSRDIDGQDDLQLKRNDHPDAEIL